MSNEATVRGSLQISTTNLKYRSYPTSFQADVSGEVGPTPGAFSASTDGTDVDLTELTTPGLAIIKNLDATNYVEVGIWDGLEFYPLIEIGPGEQYPVKLSRNIGNSYGTGTGTLGADTSMRIKADTAACVVVVEAFER